MSAPDELSTIPKPKRRQNRSCDQCRAGKRKCDVDLQNLSSFSACSNCEKWRKECTVEWLRSREDRRPYDQQGEQQQMLLGDQDDVDSFALPFSATTWTTNGPSTQYSGSSFGAELTNSLSASSTWTAPLSWSSSSPRSGPTLEGPGFSGQFLPCGDLDAGCPGVVSDTISGPLCIDNASSLGALSPATYAIPHMNYSAANGHSMGVYAPSVSDNGAFTNLESECTNVIPHTTDEVALRGNKRRRRAAIDDERWECEQRTAGMDFLLEPNAFHMQAGLLRPRSPFSSHFLSEDFNRIQIKSRLVKVYHDSFEGALSCWLTERNCPYSVSMFEDQNVWGRSWANRIFARTTALDDAYAEAGMLSRPDQNQAAKVLNAVVMAFSAQWSRPARVHDTDGDSFGRSAQKSLWHKAKAALAQASENVSFKVIFAGIIFSLTQRPCEDIGSDENASHSSEDRLSALFKLLDLDGPTLSLDAALRKLQDHRRHLRQAKHLQAGVRKAPAQLSTENQETFNLLYWLAIMFDTLSATMNRRPFTVGDADSRIGRENMVILRSLSRDETSITEPTPDDTNLWGSFFLHERSHLGDVRKQSTRWPCSYDDAAACLADAAPVKVLLYRRVGHLQSLFYQEASPQEIEKGLEAVMEVYNYWNDSYGLFISDCLKYHEALAVRIQSWYTLLAAHWNLAVLIFADLIETLEHTGMKMQCNEKTTNTTELTVSIRERAVVQISDLGYHARHSPEPLAFAQSSDFHHAVNEAALLTEPWTVVLIRAFGLAGAILSSRVTAEGPEGEAEASVVACSEARRRLKWCTDALTLLGRKSDTAMRAAVVLRGAASCD